MKRVKKVIKINETELSLEVGRVAGQAGAAVLARLGDTMVMATATAGGVREELDYFPLTVDYVERLYAGGRIKGSRGVKREGRPTDEAILAGRLVDRSVRPLFPKGFRNEVQIVVTELSVDGENDSTLLGIVAASAALSVSAIPWEGPVGGVRVGLKDGTMFVCPTETELIYSDLDLVVAATSEAVIMVEAGAKEVTEEKITAAIKFGQKEAGKVIKLIEDLVAEAGLPKEGFEARGAEAVLVDKVDKQYGKRVEEIQEGGKSKEEEYEALREEVREGARDEDRVKLFEALDEVFKRRLRARVLSGKRIDGRKVGEVRPISGEVEVLPRTHGSAIFARGETQALTVTTLGSPAMEQLIETAEGEESKRYIHHYSMPPYATGEVGRMGSPRRREIGHGALAERALLPVIPAEEKFPYTIRVVSEVLSSNGSTSMASVCGSTLSLMDAGVPIVRPVSGIAMGVVMGGKDKEKKGKGEKRKKDHVVLSDIVGMEDFSGDMDFKVAGTSEGITALQLDVKTRRLNPEILEEALTQAKKGRELILKKMLEVLPESRAKVSSYAPKIEMVKIAPEKIGEVIGPGGKTIRKIIAETGATVDVEDDGRVAITGLSEEAVEAAKQRVESLVKEVVPGEIYRGVVKRVQPFGAFVEVLPGKEGLVHISDMQEGYTEDPREVVNEGDEVEVKVKEIDNMGRINLTMVLSEAGTGERKEGRRPASRDRGTWAKGRDEGSQRRSKPPFVGGSSVSKYRPKSRF